MLQCLSNALTLAIILWLFLNDIITGVLEIMDSFMRDIGPCLNSNSSNCSSSSLVNSDFGRSNNCLYTDFGSVVHPFTFFFLQC